LSGLHMRAKRMGQRLTRSIREPSRCRLFGVCLPYIITLCTF